MYFRRAWHLLLWGYVQLVWRPTEQQWPGQAHNEFNISHSRHSSLRYRLLALVFIFGGSLVSVQAILH